jgi:small subunit ribosomal protein S15
LAKKAFSLTFAAKISKQKRIPNSGINQKTLAMSLTKEKKAGIFTQFGGAATNTGSIEGQIAMITERMAQISGHLQQNKKDFSTQRGLMRQVGRRRRLLNYLQKHNIQGYRQLIEKLGIRK